MSKLWHDHDITLKIKLRWDQRSMYSGDLVAHRPVVVWSDESVVRVQFFSGPPLHLFGECVVVGDVPLPLWLVLKIVVLRVSITLNIICFISKFLPRLCPLYLLSKMSLKFCFGIVTVPYRLSLINHTKCTSGLNVWQYVILFIGVKLIELSRCTGR